jgi:hypothetical protein
LHYDFRAADYGAGSAGGTVEIPCVPGEIIAVGQKDKRGNPSYSCIMRMEADREMEVLTRLEAKKALKKTAAATVRRRAYDSRQDSCKCSLAQLQPTVA